MAGGKGGKYMKSWQTVLKKSGIAALAAALALSVTACTGSGVPASSGGPASSHTSAAAAAPVTVKNAAGGDVTIREAPQKIVVLPVWAAEITLDLVSTERVVGLSSYMDAPVTTALADKAAKVEKRVSSEAEAILGLSPDFVVLDTFNDADGALAQTLSGAGVTVLTLASPVTYEEIADRITTLSKALFAADEGEKLVSDMQARLDGVKEKVKDIPEADRVKVMYYEASYSADGMLCAYGEGSPFQAIAEAAGVRNVCTAPLYSNVSKETVVNDWKPQVLVVSGVTYGADFSATEDGGAAMKAAILADATLKTVPAVADGRIVALTEKYRGSTSHYMAYAAEELARACYPDRFPA